MKKVLGKIKKVTFGFNGSLFGLYLTLGNDNWICCAEICYNTGYKGPNCDRLIAEGLISVTERIQKLLKDSKSETIDDLIDKPIECTFDANNKFVEFKVLTEVL